MHVITVGKQRQAAQESSPARDVRAPEYNASTAMGSATKKKSQVTI
jgi:hypothetical protein